MPSSARDAIEKSAVRNTIVSLPFHPDLAKALLAEAEDDVILEHRINGSISHNRWEFWGDDMDLGEWRVHLVLENQDQVAAAVSLSLVGA